MPANPQRQPLFGADARYELRRDSLPILTWDSTRCPMGHRVATAWYFRLISHCVIGFSAICHKNFTTFSVHIRPDWAMLPIFDGVLPQGLQAECRNERNRRNWRAGIAI